MLDTAIAHHDVGPTPEMLRRTETRRYAPDIAGQPDKIMADPAHKRLARLSAITKEAEAEAERYCEHYQFAQGVSPGSSWDFEADPDHTPRTPYPRTVNSTTYLRYADERLGRDGVDLVIAACVRSLPMSVVGRLMPGHAPRPPSGKDEDDWKAYAEDHRLFTRRQAEKAERALIHALRRLAKEE